MPKYDRYTKPYVFVLSAFRNENRELCEPNHALPWTDDPSDCGTESKLFLEERFGSSSIPDPLSLRRKLTRWILVVGDGGIVISLKLIPLCVTRFLVELCWCWWSGVDKLVNCCSTAIKSALTHHFVISRARGGESHKPKTSHCI